MRFGQLLKQVLVVYACLFALTGQAMADALSDAVDAYKAKDYSRAEKLFKPLAQSGNTLAQFELGLMYCAGKVPGIPQDCKEGAKWYRLAADQGDADAQFNLGNLYNDGLGVPQDYKEAAKWYRLAAEKGTTDAQFNLGVLYSDGRGVPQDYREAIRWL